MEVVLRANLVWLWLAYVNRLLAALKFSEVTGDLSLLHVSGQIAAFADFDSDKDTDILVVNATGVTHTLLLWRDGHFTSIPLNLNTPSSVDSIRVGDFDGDGLLDFLTVASHGHLAVVQVHWVSLNSGAPEVSESKVIANATSLPLLVVLDVDGDHRADFLTASSNGSTVWISQGNRDFMKVPLDQGESAMEGSYSHAYYQDFGTDCLPELTLLRSKGREKRLDLWTRKNDGTLVFNSSLPLSFGASIAATPPTFVDLDVDGSLEAVVLSCDGVDSRGYCTNVSLLIYHQPQAVSTPCEGDRSPGLHFSTTLKNVSLPLPRGLAMSQDTFSEHPLIGDLDLDSWPDLVLSVMNTTSNSSAPCFLNSIGQSNDFTLHPQWDLSIPVNSQLALFDLWEDGILDLVVSDGKEPHGFGWSAFKQSLSADHTFLKVLVLSGYCNTHCKSGRKPYGSILTAASVAYSTTNRKGHTQQTRATARSSTDPLQLPFVLFGLGETPNFIQKLTIGASIPAASREETEEGGHGVKLGLHTWRNLVPNSQVIVIPNPPEKPGRWHVELYLTPSHLMYTTAGVLCALAVGMAILVALLHAREKFQDHQERKQAKHKFHFNAM